MSSPEYNPEQHTVFINGEVELADDFSELPMPNADRIARMHPHTRVELDDISTQRHKEVPLSESEQALADAFEQPEALPGEVQLVFDARSDFREELRAKGYAEDRINFLISKKFGAAIARLAMQYDMTSYLAADEDEAPIQAAEIHMFPQRGEYIERERDVRERQAGPDS